MKKMKKKPYPATPILDKMKSVHVQSQAIGEFIDWLQHEKKITLAQYHQHSDTCYEDPANKEDADPACGAQENELLRWHYAGIEQLLAEYFDVDLVAAERERNAVLEHVRSKQ